MGPHGGPSKKKKKSAPQREIDCPPGAASESAFPVVCFLPAELLLPAEPAQRKPARDGERKKGAAR